MVESVFLDTNVVLDHLADRQPFAECAHRLFALAETGQLKLNVSSLSFCNLYYLLRKLSGHEQALTLLSRLEQLVEITTVGKLQIHEALSSGLRDFEDAVQIFSAEENGNIDIIVTRNKRDFSTRTIPVQSPEEYLADFERRAP